MGIYDRDYMKVRVAAPRKAVRTPAPARTSWRHLQFALWRVWRRLRNLLQR